MTETGDLEGAIDTLLDRAIEAANRGDITAVHRLASEVLAEDASNAEAGDLMAREFWGSGELRRVTLMFCDLVGSTELSGRHEPELYRMLVRRYKTACHTIIEERYDGHVVGAKGDGLLALFGVPRAHGNDVERAIRAGLEVVGAVRELSTTTERQVGEALDVRVAIHRGIVYVDREEDDVYGLAVNVASRLEGLAEPGTVVVSKEVRRLAGDVFEFSSQLAQTVKGVVEPLEPHRVIGEHLEGRGKGRASPMPVIGRADELDRLQAAWQRVIKGENPRPVGILLRGEAGIGKTRLACAIADIVSGQGATVAELPGSPFHVDSGFHAVRALIEHQGQIRADADGFDRLKRLRQELAVRGLDPTDLVPLLAPILGVQADAGYVAAASEARKLHEEISDAAYRYVVACLGNGPALLVAEDLQWFDESTKDLIGRLLRSGPGRLLIVVTSRPDTSPPLSGVEVLDVAPLSVEDSYRLLDALDPGRFNADQRRTLVARGDGIPLYLEELARAATQAESTEGLDPELRSRPTPSMTLAPAREAVPDLLYELLVARLYATAGAVPVAAAAAAIGPEVDRDLLAKVVDASGPELDAAVEALILDQILDRDVSSGRARFRHELLRDVAYELQPPSKRRELHGRVADALMQRHAETDMVDWRVVASHFELAGRAWAAADAFEHAAEEAVRRGSLAEARAHLGRAIDLSVSVPKSSERDRREVELRLRRGFLAASAEGNASTSAATDYGRCLSLAGVDAGDEEMFRTLIVLYGYFLIRGELGRSRQVLEMLRSVLSGGREFWMPLNTAGFGMIDWYEGRFGRAREQLEAAVAATRIGSHDDDVVATWFNPADPEASMYTHLALARFVAGDQRGAEAILVEAADRTDRIPFPQGPFTAGYVMAFDAWMRLECADFDGADEVIERLSSLASQHGFDSWTMVAVTERAALAGMRAVRSPAPDPVELMGHASMIQGLIATWQRFDTKAMLPFYITMLGELVAATGDQRTARSHYSASLALAKNTGMHFYDAETLRRLAHLASDESEVVSGLLAALALARDQGAHLFALRVAIDLFQLRESSSRPDLRAAVGQFTAGACFPELLQARAALVAAE